MPRKSSSTFTTYFNTEEQANAFKGIDAVEARATKAFRNIESAALRASRFAQDAIGPGFGGGRQASAAGGGDGQARALRATDAAMRQVGQSQARLAGQTATYARGVDHAADKQTRFTRALHATSLGLNIVQGPLGPLAGRVGALGRAMEELTGATLGFAVGGAALFQLAAKAEQFTQIRSKLVTLYDSQEDVNRSMADLVGISNRARQSLEPVADLYARLKLAGDQIGNNSDVRLSRLTELASKAAKASGGSSQAQAAGLFQFAQGVGSGKLAGDELKSVKENTLYLARAIAEGYKNADNSIGTTIDKLAEFAAKGKLTSSDVAEALERSAFKIEAAYERIPESLASAGNKVSNNFLQVVGSLDQTIGATHFLATGLASIAENMNSVIALAAGVGAAFLSIKSKGFGTEASQKIGELITGQRMSIKEALTMKRSIDGLDKEWIEEAAASKRAAIGVVADLEAQRQAIRRTVVELQRKQAIEDANARRLTTLSSTGTADRRRLYQPLARDANNQLTATTLRLKSAEQDLNRVHNQLGATQTYVTRTTEAHDNAVKNVTGRTSLFKAGVFGLLRAFDPLSIVIGLATTALYLFVTAETTAEAATRQFDEAQRLVAKTIDHTTGKVYEQIGALDLLARKKQFSDQFDDSKSTQKTARAQLLRSLTTGGYIASGGNFVDVLPKNERQGFDDLATDIRAGKITYGAARDRLGKLGGTSKGSEEIALKARKQLYTDGEAYRIMKDLSVGQRMTDNAYNKRTNSAADEAYFRFNQNPTPGASASDKPKKTKGSGGAGGANDAAQEERRADSERKRAAAEAERTRVEQERQAASENRERAMTALEERRGELTTQQYRDARIAVLELYDVEANAVRKVAEDRTKADTDAIARRKALADTFGIEFDAADKVAEKFDEAGKQRLKDEREIGAAKKEISDQYDRDIAVAERLLMGREAESRALERTLDLVAQIGDAGYDEYDSLLKQEEAHQKINDLLASRERIVSSVMGALDAARDGFTDMLVDLPNGAAGAVKSYLKNVTQAIFRANMQKVTEKLFSGSDARVRSILTTGKPLDDDGMRFTKKVEKVAETTAHLAKSVEACADRIDAVLATGTAWSAPGWQTTTTGAAIPANDNGGIFEDSVGPEITVTSDRSIERLEDVHEAILSGNAEARENSDDLGSIIFETMGAALDKIVWGIAGGKDGKQPEVFAKLGKTIGKALEGAQLGMMAAGGKGSKTGAAVGGALGKLAADELLSESLGKTLGPIAGMVGGIIGSAIGGLLKKTKTGTATIGKVGNEVGQTGTSGNSASYIKEAEGAATKIGGRIETIIDQLFADIGNFSVSIGKRKKKYTVDTTGEGRTRGAGVLKFDTLEEAEEAAIRDALIDGAAAGISAAARTILEKGKDLERAIEKAALIESVPQRLLEKNDPVRYAIAQLNKEFQKIIDAMKEGGATAEQFADAQKLYEMERADAVEKATQQARGAIDQFLEDMVGSSNSPLNKRDTYDNAKVALDKAAENFMKGTGDQQDLLTAARNFQDATRALNGSSESFFRDFELIRDMLETARDKTGSTTGDALPDSPFATDTAVQDAIRALGTQTTGATATQTNVLSSQLERLITAVNANGPWNSYTSISQLPGFAEAA